MIERATKEEDVHPGVVSLSYAAHIDEGLPRQVYLRVVIELLHRGYRQEIFRPPGWDSILLRVDVERQWKRCRNVCLKGSCERLARAFRDVD